MAGLLIVALVTLRAAFSVYLVADRNWQGSRLERKQARLFSFFQSISALRLIDTKNEKHKPAWCGKRKFQIIDRKFENNAQDIASFYLVPYDRRPLPPFRPGQFLTFELKVPGEAHTLTRCYSLSDSPSQNQHYRISIKRLDAPLNAPADTSPGLSSNYFHDHLCEGSIVNVHAPAGDFCLDETSERPVVFIAGGVGLTPLVSMLNTLLASNSQREIWFFYGVRNSAEHAMYQHLDQASREYKNLHVVTAYSQPGPACRKDIDYNIEGHINIDVLQFLLKARNYEFYICGPQPMMDSISLDLSHWGVPEEDIKMETFGAGQVKTEVPLHEDEELEDDEAFQVVFARTGKTVRWTRRMGTLLELAEAHGVKTRYNCRSGVCGTCKTGLKRGNISYIRTLTKKPDRGYCLPCSAHPKSDVVLDL